MNAVLTRPSALGGGGRREGRPETRSCRFCVAGRRRQRACTLSQAPQAAGINRFDLGAHRRRALTLAAIASARLRACGDRARPCSGRGTERDAYAQSGRRHDPLFGWQRHRRRHQCVGLARALRPRGDSGYERHLHVRPQHGLGSPIAVAEGIQETPDACESEIVWADNRGGDFDIYFYDTATHGSGPLIVAPGDQKDPRTSEPVRLSTTDETWAVVWSDNRDAITKGWDVYCRQGVGGVFPICARAADQKDPDVSGTTVVWVDSRNGNPDIYGATWDPLTLKVTEFPICTNPAAQRRLRCRRQLGRRGSTTTPYPAGLRLQPEDKG